MTETAIEVIILTINALGAGILLFVSGVDQKIMDKLEPLEFKKHLNLLNPAAMRDPFAVSIATIPIFAVIFYLVKYGLHEWWFITGLILWMIGASITKVTNMPVYTWVADPKNTDPEELKKQRRKLAMGNHWRAWITLLSIVVMSCQFSFKWTLIAAAALVVITYPALWVSEKYIPNGSKH